ncbi:MAG: hypothetical protein B6244_08825 [Candidatus Cloacimonetes bacterium 4572_55]|nr:MAG: hypothetical protein B6244_08825 [Candidatus Cloacimonetes bacterium 4572_55]
MFLNDSVNSVRLTDEDLIASVGQGDNRAFEELVKRYKNRLINFIFQIIGDREASEDLTQEAFVRVYRHAHRFREGATFSTWVYTIASNLAKNELRNRARRPYFSWGQGTKRDEDDSFDPLSLIGDESQRPDKISENKELTEALFAAVGSLNRKYKTIFTLRDLQGLSYEEIARILKIPMGTVKSRVNRARSALKEAMQPYFDEVGMIFRSSKQQRSEKEEKSVNE